MEYVVPIKLYVRVEAEHEEHARDKVHAAMLAAADFTGLNFEDYEPYPVELVTND